MVASRVGVDSLGQEVFKRLDELGLTKSGVTIDPAHPTGTVDVVVDDAGQLDYVIHTDVAWDFIGFGDRMQSLVSRGGCDLLRVAGPAECVSRRTIDRFVRAGYDCLTIFDLNLRQCYYDEIVIGTRSVTRTC